MRLVGLIAISCVLVATARCPVGCAKGEPPAYAVAPPIEIPLERLSPCSYRLLAEIPGHTFREGFTSVHIGWRPTPYEYAWVIDAGVLTLTPEYCQEEAAVKGEVKVNYNRRVWLGGEKP